MIIFSDSYANRHKTVYNRWKYKWLNYVNDLIKGFNKEKVI